MLQKLFNTALALIFITLVALFAYKTARQPHVLTSTMPESHTEEVSEKKTDASYSLSKEQLNAAIKEYIINNPEDIVSSLESMQQKKIQDSAKQASSYLEENKEALEKADSPPVLGNPEGDITIIVFYDYNCSFCKKANEHANEIIKTDPGVKIILRPIPILGGTSMHAAKAALAIQKISPEKFHAIHDAMMQMKSINEDSLKTLIEKHDIDYAIVDNEINSFSVKQLINKNFELAKGLGIQGAPSYIINGHFLPGLIPVDKFQTIILQLRSAPSADAVPANNAGQ
ncbi:MAG: DsbA family protein [Rickettsiaceae bacterium]|nr:DsbA family protein [Rickettsiaceae bacterium]MDP4832465.1 DsbA family protein [Rickettsiaceae bacterium]MDP5020459.1 DsbA family protein [Rickettsiaceae bacterium]MDP5083091.1 DsbA family protein [Rickettsiaceae bacterium]